MVAARPELRDRDAQMLLRHTAHDLGPGGIDGEHGAGRIDAGRALHAVRPEVAIWHDEIAAQHLKELQTDTLWIGEDGPGNLSRSISGQRATMYEATATFTLPDCDHARHRRRPGQQGRLDRGRGQGNPSRAQ